MLGPSTLRKVPCHPIDNGLARTSDVTGNVTVRFHVIRSIAVSNYRTIKGIVMPLARLSVITGRNGTGKSNLYRSLRLLAGVSQGRMLEWLAREGGFGSALWSGCERMDVPVSMKFGYASDDVGYCIDLGLPPQSSETRATSKFTMDPVIKQEHVWHGPTLRHAGLLAERHNSIFRLRNAKGEWTVVTEAVAPYDSMMDMADPRVAPEICYIRERMRGWRFYDYFATNHGSEIRRPQVGTRAPVLRDDGANLAAAIQTIIEIGDGELLARVVREAFGGSLIVEDRNQEFELKMRQPGLTRPLSAAELSDGTTRYLLWVTALLTPRPPEIMVLNEPETGIHRDLMPSLARLMVEASKFMQLVVISHSSAIVETLAEHGPCTPLELIKVDGQTRISELSRMQQPAWVWPSR